MAIIVLDDICTMNCEYCFYWTQLIAVRNKLIEQWKIDKNEVYFNKKQFNKVIQKLNDWNFNVSLWWKSIVITWWEPTMHPDFINMMQTLIKEWYLIHLLSNFSFQPDWEIAKFLLKNKNKFRFLINLNEPEKQPLWKNTIQNLINLDDEKIKVSINLYHTNYNWDPLIEVLKNTKHIHTIRLWLPNPEVSQIPAHWIIKEFKEMYPKFNYNTYEKDIFEYDINEILNNNRLTQYWQKDPIIKEYYEKLWKEIRPLINFIENELPQERKEKIDFYIDCWFDLTLFPDDVYWYLFKRLFYKNPCSIPNLDVDVKWNIKQCYTISNFWDFDEKLNVNKWISFSKARWAYKITSMFFTKWLLRNEDVEQACTAYHLREYYQLFGNLKNWELKRWEDPTKTIKNDLKSVDEVIWKYIKLFKETKNELFVIRMLQYIEFAFTVWRFDLANEAINKVKYSIWMIKFNSQIDYRINYYDLLNNFIKELLKLGKEDSTQLRKNYKEKLDRIKERFSSKHKTLPKKQLKDLDFIVEQLISSMQIL